MEAPIKCMIQCNVENEKKQSSCLENQTEETEWNEGMNMYIRHNPFVPMHSLCQCFPVIFGNHLAIILQSYPLLYSEPWQKSKMEFFLRIVITACKVSNYGVISGTYFPVFGQNTDIYGVNLRIQSEYRKIRTRNNSVFGHFSRSVWEKNSLKIYSLFMIQGTGGVQKLINLFKITSY